MILTTRRTLIACLFALALSAAGCEHVSGGGGTKRAGGKEVFAAGKTVPSDATVVSRTNGGKLIHRAQRPETMWVEDGTTGKVVHSGKVRADANVVVDPDADVVAVNDIAVPHAGKLDPRHSYRLYFKGR